MDNIKPAFEGSNEKILKDLSPGEFQQTLSCWLQEKGVIRNMKSYLKFQMINALQNTVLGKNIKKNCSQIFTLSQQALHLIVGEYLLHHQCNFALSLFSTEVNLTHLLPEKKIVFEPDKLLNVERLRFSKENIVDILELIGIPKYNQHFTNVLYKYFENNDGPLISCLLEVIASETGKIIEEQLPREEDFKDDFLRHVNLILQSLNLPSKIQNHIFNNLKMCYNLKTESYEKQFAQLVEKFKNEISIRDQKLNHLVKRKKHLEKKIEKILEENQLSQDKVHTKRIMQSEQIEKKVISECCLSHCSEGCDNVRKLCKSYEEEIERLRNENFEQKLEIEQVNFKFANLLKEFTVCQDKVNLLKGKINENIPSEFAEVVESDRNASSSSDAVTEEILRSSRMKLKLLEEESEELDARIKNFQLSQKLVEEF
ncbi:hypothetical protein ABEB36_005281 [Hypothenemus hampei]|uniref:LisH domain-containing protein n=1 Tax=Hypothenemus hampei TaxID=57062 RepID=A0ABD1EYQ3_HYPHA